MVEPIALSIPDACAALGGMSRSHIYELFASGDLVPRKLGRRTVVLVADLERYAERLPKAYVND